MPLNRSRPSIELGVILLLAKMLQVGVDSIPMATCFTIVGQTWLYLVDVPWSKWDVCLSGDSVWRAKGVRRFLLSTFEHADDMHLYFNMVSFLFKGRVLETLFGTVNFTLLLAFIVLLTNSLYVVLAKIGGALDDSIMESCAIGFSGVIFALKVIKTSEAGPGTSYILGVVPLPSKYVVWLELVVIHLMVPNASFLGHLAGILAGCAYTGSFLGSAVDRCITAVTGSPMTHEERDRAVTSREQRRYR